MALPVLPASLFITAPAGSAATSPATSVSGPSTAGVTSAGRLPDGLPIPDSLVHPDHPCATFKIHSAPGVPAGWVGETIGATSCSYEPNSSAHDLLKPHGSAAEVVCTTYTGGYDNGPQQPAWQTSYTISLCNVPMPMLYETNGIAVDIGGTYYSAVTPVDHDQMGSTGDDAMINLYNGGFQNWKSYSPYFWGNYTHLELPPGLTWDAVTQGCSGVGEPVETCSQLQPSYWTS